MWITGAAKACALRRTGIVPSRSAALAGGSVVLVAPLAATYPLVTLALSALLLRSERINAFLVAGIAITVLGIALLFGK